MTEKKRFLSFMLIAFGGGWLMMALGMLLGGMWYQILLSAGMFAPLLGVLVSHGSLRGERTGIRWKPDMRGVGKWYIAAWLGPGVLTIVCAAWYYLLLPGRFDGTMSYLAAQLPEGTELPFPLPVLAAIQIVQAFTYVPFLNMLLAVGEEAGWRGYLTPYLTKRLGRTGGLLVSGAVWGAWHWPLILLAGYEYGTGYPGAPYTGMALMCAACAAMGIVLSFLYDRAGSIWAPALAHGAINAAAGIGMLFMRAEETSLFLGPTPFGLLSGVPLFALAIWLLLKKGNR